MVEVLKSKLTVNQKITLLFFELEKDVNSYTV